MQLFAFHPDQKITNECILEQQLLVRHLISRLKPADQQQTTGCRLSSEDAWQSPGYYTSFKLMTCWSLLGVGGLACMLS